MLPSIFLVRVQVISSSMNFSESNQNDSAEALITITNESPISDRLDRTIDPLQWIDRGDLIASIYFLTRNYQYGRSCLYIGSEKVFEILVRFFPQLVWRNELTEEDVDLYIINQNFDYEPMLIEAVTKYQSQTEYDAERARAEEEAQVRYSNHVHQFLGRWGKIIKGKSALIDFDIQHEKEQVNYLAGQLIAVPYSATRFKLMTSSSNKTGLWDQDEYKGWLYGHHNTTTISTSYNHPISNLPEPVDWPRLTQRWDTATEAHVLYEYLKRVSPLMAQEVLSQLSAALTRQLGEEVNVLPKLQGLSDYTPFS